MAQTEAPGGDAARARAQRLVAVAVLLAAGLLSLPLAASLLDGEGTENLVLPAQVVAMVLLGALVGRLLPGLAGLAPSRRRAAAVGAAAGLLAALVGVVVFFLLLTGLDGA